mgnify:CR=1 FL=1
MDSDSSITFESLFDERSAVIDKSLFKEAVVSDMRTTMHVIDTEDTEDGLIVKAIDPLRSKGYNKFESNEDYTQWLQASLYQPSHEEIQEALNGNGP